MTLTVEQKIEALKEKYSNELQIEIDKLIKAESANDARATLSTKLYDDYFAFQSKQQREKREFEANEAKQKADFEKEYGVPYETNPALLKKRKSAESPKAKLTITDKAKIILGFRENGQPKYRVLIANNNHYPIYNSKNQKVTSIIRFKDENGDKQTITVESLGHIFHNNNSNERETYAENIIEEEPK